MTVGYLGPKATFTEYAVKNLFKEEKRIPFASIHGCLDAVKNGDVSFGVVPLENTIEGSVTPTLDYLIHDHPLTIVGEIVVPIQQHFMVHPSHIHQLEQLETIYSHPHALAQCRKHLALNYKDAEQIQTLSTSAAAQLVANHPTQLAAAIANELAAEEYGLTIVERDIQDYNINHTRFIIVQNEEKEFPFSSKPHEKTTLIITLPLDQSGALHQVLSAFAWRKINLTKIESRPMKTGLGNYLFIIDIDQAIDEVLIPGAIAELEALGCGVISLGSYPVFEVK
ncbi:prephenate dehydratase [Bacillus pinisoli]|uniref:prephenate dehydratase n=1 Tax=Bacillus pinisoli TaxID=2901866 RepID=UPI001FF1DDD1